MKKIFAIFIGMGALSGGNLLAQFSIQANPSNPLAVDILYSAPVSGQGFHSSQYFQFALQIPNPEGATTTATFIPAAPLSAISGFSTTKGTDYSHTTFAWASTGADRYKDSFNFPSYEIVIGTVIFSNPSKKLGKVSAIDYSNQVITGGNTNLASWTYQVDDIGTDVTDYSNLFYQSATTSIPAIDESGNVQNQKLTLRSQSLTGDSEELASSVGLFPNPAVRYVNVNGLKAGYIVSIYNISGQLVFKEEADAVMMQCNVKNLPSGSYLVKVTSDGTEQFSGKLIKH